MGDVKWIKICTDIFDDEKILLIESMPDKYAIITCWFKLLCLAGKQNNSGVFMINDRLAYTDEMLATVFRMQLNTVRMALDSFEQLGMIERIDGVITIPNWGKHQNLEQLEARREYQRQYHREYRQKQKALIEKDDSKCLHKCLRKQDVNTIEEDKDKEKEEDKDKEIKKNGLDVILYRVDDSVKETVKEFIKMRKTVKAPMTDRAIVLMINKLKEMASDPDTQIKILNQSIENSWKGLYPLKEEAKPKYQSVKPNWDINRQDADDIYAKIEQIAEG